MSTTTSTLDNISKELAGLRASLTKQKTEAMTADQFYTYCKNQMALAKKDADPAPRIDALVKAIQVAKAEGWEDATSTATIPVYNDPVSADAEKIAEHPGLGLGTGQQASPGGGAFESPLGSPSGPASNTAAPAQQIMPPAFPQSTPAASSEGWMAKARSVLPEPVVTRLAKNAAGQALMTSLAQMLADEPAKPGDADVAKSVDDGWPLDLSTPAFIEGKTATASEDDFGGDPTGLMRKG